MQFIDINSMPESHVFTFYETYMSLKVKFESINEPNEEEIKKIEFLNLQLKSIEEWVKSKMKEHLKFTKEEILLSYGDKPTLILNFYPGSHSYNKFGKELVVNIEFSDEELVELLENIIKKLKRVPSILDVKIIGSYNDDKISTHDICLISGSRI